MFLDLSKDKHYYVILSIIITTSTNYLIDEQKSVNNESDI